MAALMLGRCIRNTGSAAVTFHPVGIKTEGRLYCAPTHPLANYRDTDLPEGVKIGDYPAIGISGLSSANYIEDETRLSIQTFSDSFDAAMSANYTPVTIMTPYIDDSKTAILTDGLSMGLDYGQTWTCYNGREKACGKCGACEERLEAFKENNAVDPLEYE